MKSRWKPLCLPILLCVIFSFISLTKLWDMIICLCMCQGWTHYVKALESKSGGKTANMFDFNLQVIVKWQWKSYISDVIYEQNLNEWYHMCHRNSGQCSWRICPNDDLHPAVIPLSKCKTLCTDLMHMVVISEIAYNTSWKSRERSWIRNGEEVELYLPNTSEMIYMP